MTVQRRELFYRLSVLIAVVAVVVAFCFIDPVKYALVPKCPFKILTGLSCPGCGIQRALYALLHGHVVEAVKYNLFLVYSGPYALGFLVQRWVLTGTWQRRVGNVLENKILVNFYIITFFIWLVVRNILGI